MRKTGPWTVDGKIELPCSLSFPSRFPVFIYYAPDGCYYGLPIHGNSGTKLGIDAAGNAVTPETRTFTPDEERETRSERFLKENIPTVRAFILINVYSYAVAQPGLRNGEGFTTARRHFRVTKGVGDPPMATPMPI